MSICIFPGRFQPFHNGQLLVVKGMMTACGRAMIVICSDPDGEKGEDDMWTSEEVREMISASLLDEDIVDAEIVVIGDCADDDEWVDKIIEAAGDAKDPVVWSGKDDVIALFEAKGIQTKKISPVPGISGEVIRKALNEGQRLWRTQVPTGALDIVARKQKGSE